MTYDVLEKVSKKDLVQWMRKNVFLPNISNEKFLRDVKLSRLFVKEKELLEKDKNLNKQLEVNIGKTTIMAILIESQKNDEKIKKVNSEISKLLNDWKDGE